MAFSKEEYENLLKEIAMSGGDTDNMLKLLQKLRDDFDEREGMLRKEGEIKDKNKPDDKTEYDKIKTESKEDDKEDKGLRRDPIEMTDERGASGITSSISDANRAMEVVSKKDYDDLRRKYIDRFFGTPEEVIEDNAEDIKKDDKSGTYTFDELFRRREGME